MLPTVILLGDQLPGAELADALSVGTEMIVLLDGSSPNNWNVLSSKAPVTEFDHLALATDELMRAYGGADSVIACLDRWDELGPAPSSPIAGLRILLSLFAHRRGGTLILVTCSNTNTACSGTARAAATLRGIIAVRGLGVRVIVVKLRPFTGRVAGDGGGLALQLAAVVLDPTAIEGDEIVLEADDRP